MVACIRIMLHSFYVFKIYFILNCVCLCGYIPCVCWCPRRPEELDPLQLDFQAAVSCLTLVLEIKLRSS